jgi:flagellar biosynthetic protein FliP
MKAHGSWLNLPVWCWRLVCLLVLSVVPVVAIAQSGVPALTMTTEQGGAETWSVSIQVLALMTMLTLLPAFLLAASLRIA